MHASVLLDMVRGPEAERTLRWYFAEDRVQRYTGRRFEAWHGGGNRAATRDVITDDDLIAVQMLNVRVPAEVAIGLLDGDLGRKISQLLADIDTRIEMGTPAASDLITEESPAHRAWQLLKQQHGVDYVIAGKLLARKRPALIPVYDSVIRCQLGAPPRMWQALHDRLAADNGRLRQQLAALRAHSDIPVTVSLLRVLDVVLWMRHHSQHRKRNCPAFGTVPLN
ncbi:DUF6308 family protein [Paractinoplanes hotanensis]|uniref:DUF6308 family protein n=1 Tax=Paractinoplanes hotanensis TaxID=2906497 RepID=A0ABT0YE80_9ACTN|nr:DUF6308 family protein [Actinoplanes hotanensis]MCM4083554.1 DUF6308 family protein [Actinoplanes hotanensis]